MRNIVHQFLENKMDIPSSCVSHCRRLGKAKQGSSHPRPILVVFDSIESKHSVMKNRKKNWQVLTSMLTMTSLKSS